jgi:small-conductance mechanosensitive channel
MKGAFMFTETLVLRDLFVSLACIIGGVIIGIIMEKILLVRLKKFASRTKWQGDEIIINALQGLVILWFGIGGIYAALAYLPLKPSLSGLINKILVVVLILTATIVVAKVVGGLLKLHGEKTATIPSASLLINIARIFIVAIGILIILQSLGISVTPLITALGVGGLAVALALQPTLSNLFAGIQIILSKQLEVGDYVELDSGQRGYVTDISWRNTKIREIPNNIVVVPNAKLADAIVTNYNQPQKELSFSVQCGVAYDSDLEKVETIAIDVAKQVLKEVQGGQSEFEPFVRYQSFGDSSINFTVFMRVKEYVNQFLAKHEYIKALHRRFNKEGINIPFPIRTVYLKNEKSH